MTGQLFINGYDADTQYHVSMGEDFLNNLFAPPSPKDLIQNSSRILNGVEVAFPQNSAYTFKERYVTLNFVIEGASVTNVQSRLRTFLRALLNKQASQGYSTLSVSGYTKVFNLIYVDSSNFSMPLERNTISLSVRFLEPKPTLYNE